MSNARRDHPPLLVAATAMLVLLAVLPSSLNLPSADPSETLEYAPIPPEDDTSSDPAAANMSSLSLGTGRGLNSGDSAGPGPQAAPSLPGGRGRNSTTKRCVGKPPRQTEDPMSPPCAAYFSGNNFGSTYPGVTESEITVVVRFPGGGFNQTGNGVEHVPDDGYCDIDAPPEASGSACFIVGSTTQESAWVRMVRAYSHYFNDRFQTWGRHVHFWVRWAYPGDVEHIRAQAAADVEAKRPFAALDEYQGGVPNMHYLEEIARRGAMVFGGGFRPQSVDLYRKYAPQIWSFQPDVEHWVAGYVKYLCQRVGPFRTSHASGGTGLDGSPLNGRPRRYGFLSTVDDKYPGHQLFARLVKPRLAECGITPVVDATYPFEGPFVWADPAATQAGTQIAAQLRQQDVTTVIYLGGTELYTGQAADQARYYPEVILAGDGNLERNWRVKGWQNPNWFRNAWVVTNQLRVKSAHEDPGYQACREGDLELTDGNCQVASQWYRDYFMLFQAIQVAGPRLSPRTVDEGMHAIPRIAGSGPYIAACYFDPGDYSCVKDAAEEWWDNTGRPPGVQSPGCFRMVDEGRRYLPEAWPSADKVFRNAGDPCNAYSNGGEFDP